MQAPARFRNAPVVLALIGLVLAVYANSLANGFAFDDLGVVANNGPLHDLRNLGRLIVSPYWPDIPRANALYRPVTIASLALDWWIWSGRPFGFHLINVLLHATVTLLVWHLAVRLGADRVAAAVGAALFAVHPVHTEAVANVVGRAELLAAAMVLSGCILFVSGAIPRAARFIGVVACFAFAMGAKESAVVLPGLLALIMLWRRPAGCRVAELIRREATLFAALALVVAGHLAIRLSVLGVVGGSLPAAYLRDVSAADRIASAIRIWPEYLRLLLFPKDLSAEYGPALIFPTTWSDPLVWMSLIVGVALLSGSIVVFRRAPWITLAALWFAVTIVPVSNLFFPVGVLLAERTLYLPSVAIALAVPALPPLVRALGSRGPVISTITVLLVLMLAGARTWMRNPAWASTEAVYATLGREHPHSYRGMWYNADQEMRRGNTAVGLELYRRAFELVPRDQQLGSTYAYLLLQVGQAEDAERVVRTVFNPWFLPNHEVLVESLVVLGREEEARVALADARQRFPAAPEVQRLTQLLP